MTRIFALVLFLLSVAPRADSQAPGSHPYFPLEVGNVWIHQFALDGSGYRTTEVVGITEVVGVPHWLINVEYAYFAGATGPTATCAVRITEDGILLSQTVDGDEEACNLLDRGITFEPNLSGPTPVNTDDWLAATPITFNRIEFFLFPHHVWFAEGIGLFTIRPQGANDNFPIIHLIYAEIGNLTIGRHPDDHDWTVMHPLSRGNEWIWHYRLVQLYYPHEEYQHYRVIDHEVNNNIDYYKINIRIYDPQGDITSNHDCITIRDGTGRDSGTCPPAPRHTLLWGWTQDSRPAINFKQYGPARTEFVHQSQRETLRFKAYIDMRGEWEYWAEGIGYLGRHFYAVTGGGASHVFVYQNLVWAVIEGQEYGAIPFPVGQEIAAAAITTDLQLHPNPVASTAHVTLTLATASRTIDIEVLDLVGRRLMVVSRGPLERGVHDLEVSTRGLAAGIYSLRLRTDAESVVRRFTVVR